MFKVHQFLYSPVHSCTNQKLPSEKNRGAQGTIFFAWVRDYEYKPTIQLVGNFRQQPADARSCPIFGPPEPFLQARNSIGQPVYGCIKRVN